MKNYRICISCGKLAHKGTFLRIVRTYPSGKVQLGQGMGRSAYVCLQADCLKKAQQKKRLSRSLKTNIDKEIYQNLWQLLEINL